MENDRQPCSWSWRSASLPLWAKKIKGMVFLMRSVHAEDACVVSLAAGGTSLTRFFDSLWAGATRSAGESSGELIWFDWSKQRKQGGDWGKRLRGHSRKSKTGGWEEHNVSLCPCGSATAHVATSDRYQLLGRIPIFPPLVPIVAWMQFQMHIISFQICCNKMHFLVITLVATQPTPRGPF